MMEALFIAAIIGLLMLFGWLAERENKGVKVAGKVLSNGLVFLVSAPFVLTAAAVFIAAICKLFGIW